MDLSFEHVLTAAVTPLVFISGVGLILLSLVNRYNHAIDRTRQLFGSLQETDIRLAERRKKQVDHMYNRCIILKKSIGFLIASLACSGLLILISMFQPLIKTNLDLLRFILLFISVMAILISILLFFYDIKLSMKALEIELEKK